MKRILSLFVTLLFIAGCGGDDTTTNSPFFDEVEPPTEFTPDEGYTSQPDSHLVPEEIVVLFRNALTRETSRRQVIDDIREVANCDDLTNQELWADLVDEYQLDYLEVFGSNLDEAIRNALANDLPLERLDEGFGLDEVWVLIAAEIGDCEVGEK